MTRVTSFHLQVRSKIDEELDSGTAFFVGENLVATAFHVISSGPSAIWLHEEHDGAEYRLASSETVSHMIAIPLLADPIADLALLSCQRVIGNMVPARLAAAGATDGKQWRAAGYKGNLGGKVRTLEGNVVNVHRLPKHPRGAIDVLELHVANAIDAPSGFSGAPVELASEDYPVIGVLTSEYVQDGIRNLDAASSGALHALCILAQQLPLIAEHLSLLNLTGEQYAELLGMVEPAPRVVVLPGTIDAKTLVCCAALRGYPTFLRLCQHLKGLAIDQSLVDQILRLVQQHSCLDPPGPLQLGMYSGGLYADRERSKSSLDTIVGAWGDEGALYQPQPRDIVLDMALQGELPSLAAAVVRLAVHGGVRILHVPEPKLWCKKVLDAGPGCLGNDNEFWRPELLESGHDVVPNGHWYLAPISSPSSPETRFSLASESAEDVNGAMDRWVLSALNGKISELVGSKEIPPWFKWRIGHDLRHSIGPIWAGWHQLLADPANPGFLRDFFRAMLRVSTVENGPTETPLAARIRIGPRTVNECLYGVAFALIIEAAAGKGTVPLSNPAYNFLHNKKNAHLVALKNVGQKAIDGGFDNDEYRMNLNPGYAFMPHCTRNFQLMNLRFSSSEELSSRFRDRDDSSVAVICRDEGIQKGMKEGTAALGEYLKRQIYQKNEKLLGRIYRLIYRGPQEAT